jgi:ABC-type glycerol-3-phosphate transport system substrate-binding protein
MNNKKLILFILIILFSILICACQPQSTPCVAGNCASPSPCPAGGCLTATPTVTPRPTLTPEPTRQITAQTNRLKGVTIALWEGYPGKVETALEKFAGQFNQTNRWGIDVQIHPTGSQSGLVDEILSADKDTETDLAILYPEQAWQLDGKGKEILSLQPYLDDSEVGLSATDRKNIPDARLKQNERNDAVYGIPALSDLTLLFYNVTWARELGFTNPPATFEEFKNQACAAAQKNLTSEDKAKHGTGGWLVSYEPLTAAAWLRAFNMPEFFTGDALSEMHNTNAETGLSTLRQLVLDGCAWQGRESEPYDYFANRQALFYSGSTSDLPGQSKSMTAAASRDEWTVIPYPGVDGQRIALESGPAYFVFSGEPNKELASWLFILWLNQPEQQSQLVEAADAIPVAQSLRDDPSSMNIASGQWTSAVKLISSSQPAPFNRVWYGARSILSDAFWQVFQPETKDGDISTILQQLDSTIQDVTNQK